MFVPLPLPVPVVSTVAGDMRSGFSDGRAIGSQLKEPMSLTTLVARPNASRASVIIADSSNQRIRQLKLSSAELVTLSGSGGHYGDAVVDPPKSLSSIAYRYPRNIIAHPRFGAVGVGVGGHYNKLYAACDFMIWEIDIALDRVRLLIGRNTHGLQDGPKANAMLSSPTGMIIRPVLNRPQPQSGGDSSGSAGGGIDDNNNWVMYVCDSGNDRIREINLHSEILITLAGTASFTEPRMICAATPWDESQYHSTKPNELHNTLYITARNNVWSFDRRTDQLISIGSRTTIDAQPIDPNGIDVLPNQLLVVSCIATHCIVLVDPRTKSIIRLAGTGSLGYTDSAFNESRFNRPGGLSFSLVEQSVFVADVNNHRIRCIPLPFPVIYSSR